MSANCEHSEDPTFTRALGRMDVPEGLQAAARGIEFRKTAAFLLNQVIFNSATAFQPSRPGFGFAEAMTTYLLPRIRFMSRALPIFSGLRYDLSLCVEKHRMPRSSRSFLICLV